MKTKSKKGTKAARAPKVAKNEGARTPLKTICAKLGIEPKAARVKLRRVWRRDEEPGVQFHTKGARWDLTPREAKEVTAILGG